MNRDRILLLCFFFLCQLSLFAQANQETKILQEQDDFPQRHRSYGGIYAGDINVLSNIYVWPPLFDITPADKPYIKSSKLSVGGGGDFILTSMVTPSFSIGGFVNLGFNRPRESAWSESYLIQLGVGPRFAYTFAIYSKKNYAHPSFLIPIGIAPSVFFARYRNIFNLFPTVKFDLGFYVSSFKHPEWAYGFTLHYLVTSEFIKTMEGETSHLELTQISNFLMIGFGFSYHVGL